MKKFLFSLSLVVISAFYALFASQNSISILPPVAAPVATKDNPPTLVLNAPTSSASASGGTPVPTTPVAAPTPTPTPTPAPAPKPVGQYVDGTYTGNPADAYYGNVQVQAIIQGGKITDVQFLQYPNTHSTSVYINSQAMPYLKQEAIQAQNANVNIVSGATDTSMAFQQSLASALSQAKL